MNRIAYWTMAATLLLGTSFVSAQRGNPNENSNLRQGTIIRVRLPDNLDSDRNQNGDQFEAILDRDLVSNGRILARAGSVVFFRLVDVNAGGGASRDRSRVSFTLTGIEVDSTVIPIETNTITIGTAPNQNQRVNFRTIRNTTMVPPGYRPDGIMPIHEEIHADNRMGLDRVSEGGMTYHGSLRWRGRVEGSDYIDLCRDRVTVHHRQPEIIAGSDYVLSSPLPQRRVSLRLNRLQGRGTVVLHQQPSAANNYTAIVLITDNTARNNFYEFELVW